MGFMDKLLGRKPRSSNVAKQRLQVVLIQDRVKLSPATMEALRAELVEVISRYVDVDTTGIEISLAKSARQSRLVADVPILGSKSNTH